MSIKEGKVISVILLEGERIKFTCKFNDVLFAVGADTEMDVLKQGKSTKQQFMSNQVTALDFDS